MAARDVAKLSSLTAEVGAETFTVDATDASALATLFDHMEAKLGSLDVVLYNAAARVPGAIIDLDPKDVERVIAASTYAAFLVVQQAARRMLPQRKGAILLTGASASVKGYHAPRPCDGDVRPPRPRAERRARVVAPGYSRRPLDSSILSMHRNALIY